MSSTTPTQQAAPLMDSFQPTVRVMRLYKPGFHLVQSLPHVPHTFAADEFNVQNGNGSEFTLSPFLLLPDSFGDIYAGEKFSAYIAVVNGFAQVPFYQVTLAVRLQTATTVIDLADTRANADIAGSNQYHSKTLNCNETFDMIVSQTLTELGIHTLRVSVQYLLTPTSEVKTLRKFYRFNVLQPLVIQSSYIELNGKPMVQCEVTNATKSPIYIDELSYIPTNRNSVCKAITSLTNTAITNTTDGSDADSLLCVLSNDALADDLKLLQPTESCAFSFVFTEYADLTGKPPGFPQVKWCTSMGEFSVYRGDYTYPRATSASAAGAAGGSGGMNSPGGDGGSSKSTSIKYECLSAPAEMCVGEEAEVVIRAYNTTPRAMSVYLDCKNTPTANPGVVGGSLKGQLGSGLGSSGSGGSSIRPRLSAATSTISYANVLAAGPPSTSGHGPNTNTVHTTTAGAATASTSSHYHRGLCFSGLTFTPLGIIESADFTDIAVCVYATSPGLHDLPTMFLIDSLSGERHPVAAACRVLVHDSEEEEEVVEVAGGGDVQGVTAQGMEATAASDSISTVEPISPVQVPTVAAPTAQAPPPAANAAGTVDSSQSRTESLPPSSSAPVMLPPPLPAAPAAEAADSTVLLTDVTAVPTPPPPPSEAHGDLSPFLEQSAREMRELLGEEEDVGGNGEPSTVAADEGDSGSGLDAV